MMQTWADYLDELKLTGKVIPLRRENFQGLCDKSILHCAFLILATGWLIEKIIQIINSSSAARRELGLRHILLELSHE
jgi:hypothetical protein